MKRSYLIAGGLAAAVLAWIATGLLEAPGPGTEPGEPPAAVDPAAEPGGGRGDTGADAGRVAVQVRELIAEPHARVLTEFGRTEADRRVDVSVETTGRIVELPVEKGDRVAEGDVIARLAIDDRLDRLARAKALVASREVAYNASLQLRQEGFRARVTIAEDAAALAEARAELAAIELDIARTEVRAPFAGVIEDLPVEVGDVVHGSGMDGDSVVATLVDLDPITVVCEVTERDRPLVAPGAAAEIELVTGRRVAGTVRYVARSARPATRTFRVEVDIPNPDASITEGLTAQVRLRLDEVIAHRITPAVLSLDDRGRIGVKIVGENALVAFVPVRIIDDTPDGIWLAGLPERVRVITVGQEFVRGGQAVRAVPELNGPSSAGLPRAS